MKPQASPKVKVQVIQQEGPAILVQWVQDEQLQRRIVPAESVSPGEQVAQSELDQGIPYGCDWTKIPGVDDLLMIELHRIGVWTKADMLARSHLVRNAVQQAYVVPLVAALLECALSKEE